MTKLRPRVGDQPKQVRRCPMCQGSSLQVHFIYDTPPPLETRFPLAEGSEYWREIHRCSQCGHYLEWFEQDQGALYSGEYVSATYGGPAEIRQAFDRINALPPEKSDNVARVRFVDHYYRSHLKNDKQLRQPLRLLDIGAGLGVFPHRMKMAGWQCTAIDMDERLSDHHQKTVGIRSLIADIRTVENLGCFNLVTLNKVLEHIQDPVSVLSSIPRLLEPQGMVYLELPDGEAAEAEGKEREEYLLGHIHVFSFASFSLLVMHSGLTLNYVERVREPSGKFTLRGFATRKNNSDNP